MVGVIDVAPNAISHRAADQDIREIVFLTREASDAYYSGNSVNSKLHQRAIVILAGDHRRQRPRRDAVSGWKRRSSVKEITTTLAGKWTASLRDLFERRYHDCAINQRFRTE